MIKSFLIAVSMYTKIPVHQFEWKKEDMRYCIIFLPVVGLFIGAFAVLLGAAAMLFGWNHGVMFIMAAIPVILTGGIHLDGFMDTEDAFSSYASREKKLEILKDPHVGSFAVIRLVLYFLLVIAGLFFYQTVIYAIPVTEFALIFVLSRTGAALAMVYMKNARGEGLAYTFSEAADKKKVRIILIVMAVILAAAMICLNRVCGIMLLASEVLICIYYRYRMYKEFGGITGDTEGWLICMSELAGLFAITCGGIIWNCM